MPAYNAERTIGESIDSVLRQTAPDFEFLILDDGSTDKTAEIVEGYRDPRIRLVKNDKNLGLIATLNRGIALAKGEWIARMDADDRMLPRRLERQMAHVEAHPEVDVLGSFAYRIDENGRRIGRIRKPKRKHFSAWAWIPTPLLHPTVFIRTKLAQKYPFSLEAVHCEDYELWLRLLRAGACFDNLSEELMEYRVHGNSVTSQARVLQLRKTFEVFTCYFPEAEVSEVEFLGLIGVARTPQMGLKKRVRMIEKIIGRKVPVCLGFYEAVLTLRAYVKAGQGN